MNTDNTRLRAHTKIFFLAGLLFLATGFIVVFVDISRHGIQIFPTAEQIERGHKIDLFVDWLIDLGLVAELVGLVCLAFDSAPTRPANTMRERM